MNERPQPKYERENRRVELSNLFGGEQPRQSISATKSLLGEHEKVFSKITKRTQFAVRQWTTLSYEGITVLPVKQGRLPPTTRNPTHDSKAAAKKTARQCSIERLICLLMTRLRLFLLVLFFLFGGITFNRFCFAFISSLSIGFSGLCFGNLFSGRLFDLHNGRR